MRFGHKGSIGDPGSYRRSSTLVENRLIVMATSTSAGFTSLPSITAAPMSSDPAKPSVLILTYQFPPVNGTGARRPYYLARQLADEGHRVSILTTEIHEDQPWLPNTNGIRVHRTPKTRFQRDTNFLQRALARAYWKFNGKPGHGILRVAADLLLPEGHIDRWDILPDEVEQHLGRHDIVLATCPTWYPFRLAARVAKRWRAMYVADYRDPWSVRIPTLALGEFTGFGTGLAGWMRTTKMRWAERRVTGSAFAVTAISQPLLENALMTNKVTRCMTVHGGYDPLLGHANSTTNKRFTLVYTGRVYSQQDWGSVLQVIEHMHAEDPFLKDKFRIAMYGVVCTNEALLARMKEVALRTGVLEMLPRLSRADTMHAQQTADALLHLSLDNHQGSLPVKFLEYLGAGRPIVLFIKEPDLESEVVERTRTGIIVNNATALRDLLTERLSVWQAGGSWDIHPDKSQLDTFNYAYQMRLWTEQLRKWYVEFQQQSRS
jgi:glycosyltransferase involved in cell wall biosynthesis